MDTSIFDQALERIDHDIHTVFAKIGEEARLVLEDNRHTDLQHQQDAILRHIERDLNLYSRLLRDTLMNYLADDALRALTREPASVRNAYHAARAKWLDEPLRNAPATLPDFTDRRLAIAGGTSLVVLVGVRFLGISSVPLLVATSASAVAGALAYRYASEAARLSLGQAVDACLAHAESAMSQSARQAVAMYSRAFDEFLNERSIVPSVAS